MIGDMKPVVFFRDTSTTNAATASGTVDTLGYKAIHIAMLHATSNSTSNKWTVCQLSECDTSNGTFVTNASWTGGTQTSTSVGFVIPTASTSAAQIFAMHVDLRGRKRYLKLVVSPATTEIVGAIGLLDRGEQAPSTTSTTDLALIIRG